jgi:uncharacterized protein YceH (UPF0502 family)
VSHIDPIAAELDALRAGIREIHAAGTGVSLVEVARRAGVKERWLRHLLSGEIPEPGYAKVRRLQEVVRQERSAAGRKARQAAQNAPTARQQPG